MLPINALESSPTSLFLLRGNKVQLTNYQTGEVSKQTVLDCSPEFFELKSGFSDDKRTYVVHTNSEVLLFNLSGEVVYREAEKGISKARFLEGSSRFFMRVVKAGTTYTVRLSIWDGKELRKVEQFEAGFFKSTYDYLRLDNLTNLVGVQTKQNEIDVYQEEKGKLVLKHHLEIPNQIIDFQVRPDWLYLAADDGYQLAGQGKPTLDHKRIFNNVQEVKLVISADGSIPLANAHRIVDTTGNSYYGLEKVFFYNQSKKLFDEVVSFKGSIHDLKLSPDNKQFIVISGSVPSFTVLYDTKNAPQFMLSHDFRNNFFFAPNNAFVAVAGFGSLTGEIEIWNLQKKEFLGSCTSSFASCLKWSPDSAYFITAIVVDKLKVDHRFAIYSYNGTLIKRVTLDVYDLIGVDFAFWRPTDQSIIDKPQKRAKEGGAMIKFKMEPQKVDEERIKNYLPGEPHLVKVHVSKPTLTVGGAPSGKEAGSTTGGFFNSKKGGENKFKVKRD